MKKESVRLNDYSGSEWAKASLSVLKFNGTAPLKRKEHGAAFPFTLARHFISTYSKENDLIFENFRPPADFPLCFPKENDQIFERKSASGGFSFVFP